MASKKEAQQAGDLLKRNRVEALSFAQAAGVTKTRRLLKAAQEDLEERLDTIEDGPGESSFTGAQIRATLRQVRLVLRQLAPGIREVAVASGKDAAETGVESTATYLTGIDKIYRGVGSQPLALPVAKMLEVASQGAEASILRRLLGDPDHPAQPGILERYGASTVGHFETILQKGVIAKKSWADMRDDITDASPFLQAAPGYWATRIVRTEIAGALNKGQFEATKRANEELGDMVKILSSVDDDRTGADSLAVHGQIRRPEEPFETWYGLFLHPPDRPNDRALVIPHRIVWPLPPYLAWYDAGVIAQRWLAAGNKQRMPARPLMTTVPLDQFGQDEDAATESP